MSVQRPPEQPAPDVAAVTQTTWAIDPVHTTIEFAVRHMMVSTAKGRFAGVKGQIMLDESDLSRSAATVEIDVATVDTRDENRDNHLRSAEFFDAATYPTMTFTSTAIERVADGYRVTGDLTLRGVTRPVVLQAEYQGQSVTPWGTHVVGIELHGAIKRSDFGLTWNTALETGGFLLSEEIKLSLNVEAIRQ